MYIQKTDRLRVEPQGSNIGLFGLIVRVPPYTDFHEQKQIIPRYKQRNFQINHPGTLRFDWKYKSKDKYHHSLNDD